MVFVLYCVEILMSKSIVPSKRCIPYNSIDQVIKRLYRLRIRDGRDTADSTCILMLLTDARAITIVGYTYHAQLVAT